MKRSKGSYSKRGRRLKSKGRVAITGFLKQFKAGEHAMIDINPRFKQGRPVLKFNRRMCKIIAKRGNAYEVLVKDLNKEKRLMVSNIHLVKT
jgi:ribosomal protein L21E